MRIVDGVNMAMPLPGRDHMSVALEMVLSEGHRVFNATGWEPSFKGVLRWVNLFSAALNEFEDFLRLWHTSPTSLYAPPGILQLFTRLPRGHLQHQQLNN